VYASSGFVFAATTISCIANNKHYSSDVLAGAGLVTGAVTNYNPFQAIKFVHK
jgi:hypothetical protein